MPVEPDPPLLALAEKALGARARRLPPAARAALRQRADELARVLRIADQQPELIRLLTGITGDVRAAASVAVLTMNTLETALTITGTYLGTVHLLDTTTGALTTIVQAGFDAKFLANLATVDDDSTPWGRVARRHTQVVIPDVNHHRGFAPHRQAAAAAGFRAAQSTPLTGTGRVSGVVSTYFRQPHRPSDRQLRSMAFLGDLTGAAIAACLDTSWPDEPDRPAGEEIATFTADVRSWLGTLGPGLVGGPQRTHDTASGDILADLVAAYLVIANELAEVRPKAHPAPTSPAHPDRGRTGQGDHRRHPQHRHPRGIRGPSPVRPQPQCRHPRGGQRCHQPWAAAVTGAS
jgi:GAF domain-containing protein